MVSTNPIWAHAPIVVRGAPARPSRAGTGSSRRTPAAAARTVHDGGVITFDQLADDVLALIDALDLDRPLIAGFSEGGITATIAAIRCPDRFAAIVNDAGYDVFNPRARRASR